MRLVSLLSLLAAVIGFETDEQKAVSSEISKSSEENNFKNLRSNTSITLVNRPMSYVQN